MEEKKNTGDVMEIFQKAQELGSGVAARILFAIALHKVMVAQEGVVPVIAYDREDRAYAVLCNTVSMQGIALPLAEVQVEKVFARTQDDMDVIHAPEFPESIPRDELFLRMEKVFLAKLLKDFRVNILDSLYLLDRAADIMRYMIGVGAIDMSDALAVSILQNAPNSQRNELKKFHGEVPLPPCSFDFEPNTRKPYRKEAECCSSR